VLAENLTLFALLPAAPGAPPPRAVPGAAPHDLCAELSGPDSAPPPPPRAPRAAPRRALREPSAPLRAGLTGPNSNQTEPNSNRPARSGRVAGVRCGARGGARRARERRRGARRGGRRGVPRGAARRGRRGAARVHRRGAVRDGGLRAALAPRARGREAAGLRRPRLRCDASAPPPPLPRTNRTSLVPPLVLSGHAASLPGQFRPQPFSPHASVSAEPLPGRRAAAEHYPRLALGAQSTLNHLDALHQAPPRPPRQPPPELSSGTFDQWRF